MDCAPQLHIAAYHTQAGYNDKTPGLGIVCRNLEGYLIAVGRFNNSVFKKTNYGIAGYQWRWSESIQAGIFAGVGTGYLNHPTPLVGGVITLWKHVNLIVIPPEPRADSPLTFALTHEF